MGGPNADSIVQAIRQSPPIDLSIPYEDSLVKGKTIIITGGASGFGAAFTKKWAQCGATVVVGDINVEKGDRLVRSLRAEIGNDRLHFVHCDVTDWQSQVDLFKAACEFSPHGGIDAVVANAGIAGDDSLERPRDVIGTSANPPPPDFKVIAVNLTGVLYTTHLALFYLGNNPISAPASPSSGSAGDKRGPRDRHLLLIGSVASLTPLPGLPQYTIAKHGVLGLFRSLRATSFVSGIRVNMVCPYYINTPLLPTAMRVAVAGGALGKVEDVVDAATRFVADSRIVGRALVVGPKVKVEVEDDGEWSLVPKDRKSTADGTVQETALWEAYADDYENVEIVVGRFIRLLNAFTVARGWIGWARDMAAAVAYGIEGIWH